MPRAQEPQVSAGAELAPFLRDEGPGDIVTRDCPVCATGDEPCLVRTDHTMECPDCLRRFRIEWDGDVDGATGHRRDCSTCLAISGPPISGPPPVE